MLAPEKTKTNISCSNSKWNQKSSQGAGGEVQPLTELLQTAKSKFRALEGVRKEKDVRVEILQHFYNSFLQFIHFQMTKSNFADKARAPEEEQRYPCYKFVIFLLFPAPINRIQRNSKNV